MVGDEIEEIGFLARSQARIRILELLNRETQVTRDELRQRLDVSRTTIQRNLDALVDHGWVHNSGRTYTIASCGGLVANKFLELAETIQVARRLQPFLEWVDQTDLGLDLRLLKEAQITTADSGDPWAMVNRHVMGLRTMESGRLLLPLTGLHPMEALTNRVVNHGAEVELIVAPSVAEMFLSKPEYRRCFDRLLAAERCEIAVTDDEIPYYLGILDETVQIGVDENGEPRALLETSSNGVKKWAQRKCDDYVRRSEQIHS